MITKSYENPTMPIGIAPPTVKFLTPTPPPPVDWSEEVAGYYYIDSVNGKEYDRISGVNYYRAYGTPEKPRLTMPTSVTAGSVVFVKGTYKYSSNTATYNVNLEGTDEDFIAGVQGHVWVTSFGDEKAIIPDRPIAWSGKNFFVENLKITAPCRFGTANNGSDWSVTNGVLRYCSVNAATAVLGSEKTKCSHIVIYQNELHDGGDITSSKDTDVTGVQVQNHVNNLWILDNHIHHMQGSGIQVLGQQENTQRIFAGRNHIHHCRQAGMWVKAGTHIVFSTNHVHDIITTFGLVSASQSPSKGIGGQYTPSDYWIINNLIYNCSFGIRIPSYYGSCIDPSVYMIGNIVHSCSPQGDPINGDHLLPDNPWGVSAIQLVNGVDRYVYNNLIANSAFAIKVAASNNSSTYIKNNILMCIPYVDDDGSVKDGVSITTEWSRLGVKDFIENNYFDESMSIHIGGSIYTHPSDFESGAMGNIKGPELFDFNELLDSIASKDLSGFSLGALENAGVDVAEILIDRFKVSFPDSDGLFEDYLGKSRVQNGGIDIGPFESGEIFIEKTPEAPVGLNIDASNQALLWDKVKGNFVYDIYKNDELLIADVNAYLGRYEIAGITSSVDEYAIVAKNSAGTAVSDTVTSMVMSVVPFQNNADLSGFNGYLLPRQSVLKKGNLALSQLESNTDMYGLPNERVKFSVPDFSDITGGVYFEASPDHYMGGTVTGSGTVMLVITCSAMEGEEVTAELSINNNVVLESIVGGFSVLNVNVDFESDIEYKLTSKEKHAGYLGIAAVIEVNATGTDIG